LKGLKHKRGFHDRTSRRRRARTIRLFALLLAAVPVIFAAGLIRSSRSFVQPLTASVLRPWSSNPSENLAILAGGARYYSAAWKTRRPVYTYSLIPGGAQTPEELQVAISRDRQLASHYAGFQYRKARIATLDRPQFVYLSYRKNGVI